MKRLIGLGVALVALTVAAGEIAAGTLTVRGASTNNKGGTGDAGFLLGTSQKITVQCSNPDAGSAGSYICINAATCTARLGVLITGNQALPTSTAANRVVLIDGGYTALISAYSAENNDCNVFTRQGNEF